MVLPRAAAILAVLAVLLLSVSAARAATSSLSQTPPVPLPAHTPSPGHITPARVPATTTARTATLPKTGSDLPLELVVAALLLTAGVGLRLGQAPDRS